ncbi:BPSS1780 family membrane protein [Piscinibacter sp.]|uniref:BPSS1780 family membrane protein n=1 Tax=Piscinibacter sp. TaxID=1903157 RepID=UPI0039E54FB2
MRLQTVPATAGHAWVRQGWRVFARQPLAFSGLFAAFLFGIFALTLLPLVGPLLLLALLPLGSLGFMIGTREALQGRVPLPRVFVDPLRRGRRPLRAMLTLGVLYAVGSVLIINLAEWADGGALERLMDVLADGKATPEDVAGRIADPQLAFGVALRFGLAGLLSIPFWHAPALVHWGAQGAAQSLFSSTLAIWRNKGAFAVFALAWSALVLATGAAANLAGALLGAPQVVAVLAMPASLLLSTVFYVSLYFSFADCFADGAASPAAALPPPNGNPP